MALRAIDGVFHRHHRIPVIDKEIRRIPEVSGMDKVKQDVGWALFGAESSNVAGHGEKRLAGMANEAGEDQ